MIEVEDNDNYFEDGMIGLMVENVRTIVVALGGDAEGLQYVDTSPIFQGESQVIYP